MASPPSISHPRTTSPRPRARRTPNGRGAGATWWLTDRDRWILAAVAENQILTSDHLTALAFTARRSAQRRLTRLTDAGYLERFRPPRTLGSSPAHYLLTALGASLLTAHADDDTSLGAGRPRGKAVVTPSPSTLRLRHTLGVADLYVALATPGRDGAAGQLRRWWGERTCAAWWGRYARPDAYGRWHGVDRTGRMRVLDLFLEYDTGSENLGRLISKLHGYRQLAEATGITTTVLFHLQSPVREQGLHGRLAGEGELGVPIATSTARTDLAGPVWRAGPTTLAQARSVELRSLADLGVTAAGGDRPQRTDGALDAVGAVHPWPWPPPPPLPPAQDRFESAGGVPE